MNGFKPPSGYKNVDTLLIARKMFGFTSNKLEYMSDKLCVKHKKLKHTKFPGFELWKECLAGNTKAWNEMKRYNINDVLALEELYQKLRPWDSSINHSIYDDNSTDHVCACGSTEFVKKGFHFTGTGKFQRYGCKQCGSRFRDRTNLFRKTKRASLKVGIS
jgi:hypothetical protein